MSSPRATLKLIGHGALERLAYAALSGDRPPQAWLLAGPPGVGKATFAYRMARFLLARNPDAGGFDFDATRSSGDLSVAPDHPVVRQVAVGTHPDLLAIEREIDEKRDKMKTAIGVDQIRAINQFLHLTAAQGGWRIVLIDPAEAMNRNAANALLKILEEPPKKSILLLVSHTPGRLLATIRSRCRLLRFAPLSEIELRAAIGEEGEIDPLTLTLADGAPGRAIALANPETRALLTDLLMLLKRGPGRDPAALHAFAERLAKAEADGPYREFVYLFDVWLMRVIREAARTGAAPKGLSQETEAAQNVLIAAGSLDRLIAVWEKSKALFQQAESLNLDRKQTILSALLPLTPRS